MSKSKILVMMTGSIACFKACALLSRLAKENFELEVVLSSAAEQFVGKATIEGLTGRAPHTDLFASGGAMKHISLARWADLILLAPATANSINKLANGVGDDLVTTLFLAHDFSKPFLLAPAMNTSMYLHPVTQGSIQKLKGLGVGVLETASGVLACGEEGLGRLLEPDAIYAEIASHLQTSKVTAGQIQKKVLVTSGGTQEPIDAVRVIANHSTGRTGARIAESLHDRGYEVVYLHAETAELAQRSLRRVSFRTYLDLSEKLQELLKTENFYAVVHAAAVSDFSLSAPLTSGKLSSEEDCVLHLKKNPKLVNRIKEWSNGAKLVAFKMTSSPDKQTHKLAVEKLFNESAADFIVHNDVSEIDWRKGQHSYHWHLAQAKFNENLNLVDTDQLTKKLTESLSDPKGSL